MHDFGCVQLDYLYRMYLSRSRSSKIGHHGDHDEVGAKLRPKFGPKFRSRVTSTFHDTLGHNCDPAFCRASHVDTPFTVYIGVLCWEFAFTQRTLRVHSANVNEHARMRTYGIQD
jgi:hypothetical protein